MRLDGDALDRSPLDRSGESLAPGEFRVGISVAVGVSASLSNVGFAVPIVIDVGVSPSITAYPASFSVGIPVTLNLSVKITPTLNIDKLLVSATIRRSMSDKMASATFNFDKATYAGYYSSIYWTKLIMRIPDYANNWNVVFSGIAPGSLTNYTHMEYLSTPLGNQTVTAYDYQWYLTSQTLEPADQVLLTWANQQTDYIYKLEYDGVISGRSFTVGDVVWGVTSHDFGTVIEVNSTGYYIRLKGVCGSAPYFQDNEYLAVGSTAIAQADGTAVNDSGTITQKYPTDYIKKLLGEGLGTVPSPYGEKWAEVSGIYPKTFDSDAGWYEKEFVFKPTTTKAQAIEEICQYMKRIFYVRYETVGGVPGVPCAYFFDEADLDTVGCLPDPVYVTCGEGRTAPLFDNDAGGYVTSPFTLTQKGENQYNWVQVRCQAVDGKWYQQFFNDSDVYDPIYNSTGTIPKIPYYEVNPNIATSTDCYQRASDLWSYYGQQVCTWTVTFELRSDLILLQKLIVSRFGPAIPDDDYRIVDIEYDYDTCGTRNFQRVTLVSDGSFKAYLNLKRIFTNSIGEIQNVIQDLIDKTISTEAGVVVEVFSGYHVLVAVDGSYGSVRRTASTGGATIVVGDKVTLSRRSDGLLIASRRDAA